MRAAVSLPLAALLVLALAPGWTGERRLDLPAARDPGLRAERVALDPARPGRVRLGALTYLGGIALASDDPGFGGYSALAVKGDRFTLLSDGGVLLRFRMGPDWRPRGAAQDALPAGPDTGWSKMERDSESLAMDGAGGPAGASAWAGFERANEVWRYAVGPDGRWRAVRGRAPAAMRDWDDNGGAESMVRLPDGRFLLLSETTRPPPGSLGEARGGPRRDGLVFPGDPTAPGTRPFRFAYRPEPGFDPSDAAALPDGRLVVLERRFGFPNSWANRLALVAAGAVRPGAFVAGRTLARLEAPLLHDNFEGVAAVREGGVTVLWLVSDDNQTSRQRTLLLKFRLN